MQRGSLFSYPLSLFYLLVSLPPSQSSAFRVPLTFSCQRTITLTGKPARHPRGWNMIFISRNMISVLCSDFCPLFNQINLFKVINIWGIINLFIYFVKINFVDKNSYHIIVIFGIFVQLSVSSKRKHLSAISVHGRLPIWPLHTMTCWNLDVYFTNPEVQKIHCCLIDDDL